MTCARLTKPRINCLKSSKSLERLVQASLNTKKAEKKVHCQSNQLHSYRALLAKTSSFDTIWAIKQRLHHETSDDCED